MLEGPVYHGDRLMGEWKFVDEDWGSWTPEQRKNHWLRTWKGMRQVLRWFPGDYSQDTIRDA